MVHTPTNRKLLEVEIEKTLKNDVIYLKNTKVTHHQIVSDNLSIYNLFHIFICSVKHWLSDLRWKNWVKWMKNTWEWRVMTQNRSLLMLKKNKKTLQIISCLIKECSIREHQDQSQCPGYLNQILHVRAASSVGIIIFYLLTVVWIFPYCSLCISQVAE